jgi:hypothetical protein
LGDPLKGNLLLFYKPLHLEAQQVSTRIEVRRHQLLAPLKKAKHAWVDELPSVLWSLRTTPNATTQETPFFLVHGAEAVLPVEVTHEAPRIVAYDEATSTEALQDDVDALDEARDVALTRATQYQQNLQNYHSSRVRP